MVHHSALSFPFRAPPLPPPPRPLVFASPRVSDSDLSASSPCSCLRLAPALGPIRRFDWFLSRLPGETFFCAGGGASAASTPSTIDLGRRDMVRTSSSSAIACACIQVLRSCEMTGIPSHLTTAAPVAVARQALRTTCSPRVLSSCGRNRARLYPSAAEYAFPAPVGSTTLTGTLGIINRFSGSRQSRT